MYFYVVLIVLLSPSLVKKELQGVKQKNYIDSKNNKHTHDEEHIFGMLLIFVLIRIGIL